MTTKDKSIRIIAIFLLSVTVLFFSASVVFLLLHFRILPNVFAGGVFENTLLVTGYCAIIGTATGIPGFLLCRYSQKQMKKSRDYKFTLKKTLGSVLMSLSVIALTYSLYLILYYFDIIPNRNLGFMDISHLVAGIVAAPAAIIGAIGLLLYKK